jgi:hypothetical protein
VEDGRWGKIISFLSPLLCNHFIREIEEVSRLVGRLRGAGVLGRRLPAIEVSRIQTNGLNSTGRYLAAGDTTNQGWHDRK